MTRARASTRTTSPMVPAQINVTERKNLAPHHVGTKPLPLSSLHCPQLQRVDPLAPLARTSLAPTLRQRQVAGQLSWGQHFEENRCPNPWQHATSAFLRHRLDIGWSASPTPCKPHWCGAAFTSPFHCQPSTPSANSVLTSTTKCIALLHRNQSH